MTTEVLSTATTPSDDWRVRRYGANLVRQIPDPITGELRNYQRVSTFAKTLDEMGTLPEWIAWCVLRGAEYDNTLKQKVLHAQWGGTTPVTSIKELKRLGGGDEKMERGKLRHETLAMALHGHRRPGLTPADNQELDAVLSLIDTIGEVQHTEAPNVNDQWETAGTVDMILRAKDGRVVVADFKTGSRDYPAILSTSIQLIAYARSWYWDFATETRTGLVVPGTDLPRLYMIHAPQDGGPPMAVELDVMRAVRWADLAYQVRLARKEAKK